MCEPVASYEAEGSHVASHSLYRKIAAESYRGGIYGWNVTGGYVLPNKNSLTRRRRGGSLGYPEPLSGFLNSLPQFLTSRAAFRRVGKNARHRILLAQRLQSVTQLIARESVALGGDQEKVAARRAKEVQQLAV